MDYTETLNGRTVLGPPSNLAETDKLGEMCNLPTYADATVDFWPLVDQFS